MTVQVDGMEERALRRSADRLHHLQMLEGDGIDQEAVGARTEGDGPYVRQVHFLSVAEVLKQGTRGADGRAMPSSRPKPSRPPARSRSRRVRRADSWSKLQASAVVIEAPWRVPSGSRAETSTSEGTTISRGRSAEKSHPRAPAPRLFRVLRRGEFSG